MSSNESDLTVRWLNKLSNNIGSSLLQTSWWNLGETLDLSRLDGNNGRELQWAVLPHGGSSAPPNASCVTFVQVEDSLGAAHMEDSGLNLFSPGDDYGYSVAQYSLL